jgi:hypothetical protein
MHFIKNHKTSLEAEEMQLIRPTSEFKVGHLPGQGQRHSSPLGQVKTFRIVANGYVTAMY